MDWHPEQGEMRRRLQRWTSASLVNKQSDRVLWKCMFFYLFLSETFHNSLSTWYTQSWPMRAANILFQQISFSRVGHRVSWNNISQHQNVNACRLPRILIMRFQIEYLCRGFHTKDRYAPINRHREYVQKGERERPVNALPYLSHTHTHTHTRPLLPWFTGTIAVSK
jgi:hypothetical protein